MAISIFTIRMIINNSHLYEISLISKLTVMLWVWSFNIGLMNKEKWPITADYAKSKSMWEFADTPNLCNSLKILDDSNASLIR